MIFKDEEVVNVKKKVKEVIDISGSSDGQLLVMQNYYKFKKNEQ